MAERIQRETERPGGQWHFPVRSPAQVVAAQQSRPRLEPEFPLYRPPKRIDVRPSFCRGASKQMLMRPHEVVEETELAERDAQRSEALDLQLVELALERQEQPLDAAVLPRAARIAALMADAGEPQRRSEDVRHEHRLVVRAQETRLAVVSDGQEQMAEQRPGQLVRQCCQREQGARAMINQAEDGMNLSGRIAFARQVHRPNQIPRHGRRQVMLDRAPQNLDLVPMSANRFGDERLADCRSALDR